MYEEVWLTSALAVLGLIWGGYPFVLRLLGALRSAPSEAEAWRPSVSVVLATRESPAVVRARVENLLETNYPADQLEVIIALDAARPANRKTIFDGDEQVKIVKGDLPGGKACTLNAGVRSARGEVLVFADSHQQYSRSTIPALVAALGGEGVGLATGRLEVPTGARVARLYWRYERWLRRWESVVHSPVGATGAIYAIRRAEWPGLPPDLILDDLYVPMHVVLAGKRVRFTDGATAVETRIVSPEQEYARKLRTLTGVLQLCAWLPHVLSIRRNPIWVQFVFHKILRFLTPYLLLLALFAAAVSAVEMMGFERIAVVAVAVIVVVILTRKTRYVRVLGRVTREAGLLQIATARAAVNGARRNWSVWH